MHESKAQGRESAAGTVRPRLRAVRSALIQSLSVSRLEICAAAENLTARAALLLIKSRLVYFMKSQVIRSNSGTHPELGLAGVLFLTDDDRNF